MRWLIATALLCNTVSIMVQAQEQVPVRVAMPQEQGLSEQLVLSGSLTAQQDASLSSRTAGLVAELLVDAGSTVKKGQPLLKLDTALAQHELAQRQAALSAAQVLQTERLRLVTEAEKLTEQQLFPQTELSLRRAALAEADAMLQQAKAEQQQQQEIVARHTLTAPFAGVIAQRTTDVGEWVALGTPVLQLVSLAPLLLDVQVPQEYFAALSALRRIEVRADMLPAEKLSAKLLATVPVGSSSARSFLARLEVTDGQQVLLPGTSASATFYFERDDATVLVVPPDALLRHPDGNFSLFAIRDNKAYRHNVTLGRSSEQGVEILSGLPKGQAVVVRGNETLRDGQAVRVLSDDKE
ncbi:RND family efflux transporter, MFP subunit [Rheinheimera pacifica]|uniref:RND family efflux transporter, MFP subunit n=1 Tax=Rheinheimera pacifica TaxID=173990 RepID=A0A1H6N1R9_9GAMM|nr:efflux RND transporter periplasmic adaptor subunit [Rheinheimera pacifica]SEI08543.1 RND family efflux transporter, MFP subunit [Rheinheimera pacifica]